MDMVVQGNFAIRGGSGPLLEEAMFAVAKRVSDVLRNPIGLPGARISYSKKFVVSYFQIESATEPGTNLYDQWVKYFPEKLKNGKELDVPT